VRNLVLCELSDPGLDGVESYSPFCLKVHRALKWSGLHYERRHGEQPATFRKLNPAAQVPVLIVDGQPLGDSTRIIQKLATLSARPLFPATIREKAEAQLWEELADTALNGFLVAARWADGRNWPRTRTAYFPTLPALVKLVVPDLVRNRILKSLHARDIIRQGDVECWRRFGELLDALDARAPLHGFWVNDALCVADLAIFAQLHSLCTPLTPWQGGEVALRPRLSAYLARVHQATWTPANVARPRAQSSRQIV